MHRPFYRKATYCRLLDRNVTPDPRRDAYLVTQSASTIAQYRAALLPWYDHCKRYGVTDLPADANDVVDFLLRRVDDDGMSYPQALKFISALNCLQVSNRFEAVTGYELRALLKKLECGHRRKPAPAASVEDVHQMCDLAIELKKPLMAARDVSIITFAWATLERPIEYANAKWEHLQIHAAQAGSRRPLWEQIAGARVIIVRIPVSKADRAGNGQFASIRAHRDPRYCPVRALAEWCRRSGRERGAIFPRIRLGGQIGTKGLRTSSIRNLIKAYAAMFGQHRTPYSLRRGRATDNDRRHIPRDVTRRQLRHDDYRTTDLYVDESLRQSRSAGAAYFR